MAGRDGFEDERFEIERPTAGPLKKETKEGERPSPRPPQRERTKRFLYGYALFLSLLSVAALAIVPPLFEQLYSLTSLSPFARWLTTYGWALACGLAGLLVVCFLRLEEKAFFVAVAVAALVVLLLGIMVVDGLVRSVEALGGGRGG